MKSTFFPDTEEGTVFDENLIYCNSLLGHFQCLSFYMNEENSSCLFQKHMMSPYENK